MPLFLVVGIDVNGENMDFFVRADDATEAYGLYKSQVLDEFNDVLEPKIWTVPGVEGEKEVCSWSDQTMTSHPSIVAEDEDEDGE